MARLKPAEQRAREGGSDARGAVSHRPIPQPVSIGGRASLEELVEPPAHLPEQAQDYWREVVPHLVDSGVVDRVDVAALEGLCLAYARAREIGEFVKVGKPFTRGSTGQWREAPWIRAERAAWADFYRYAAEFGLTPASRTSLGVAGLVGRTLQHDLDQRLGPIKLVEVVDSTAEPVA